MEVVGEMQQNNAATGVEGEAKLKQQALVGESIALLGKLANRGHVKSQYFLADCYTQGIGTPKVCSSSQVPFPPNTHNLHFTLIREREIMTKRILYSCWLVNMVMPTPVSEQHNAASMVGGVARLRRRQFRSCG